MKYFLALCAFACLIQVGHAQTFVRAKYGRVAVQAETWQDVGGSFSLLDEPLPDGSGFGNIKGQALDGTDSDEDRLFMGFQGVSRDGYSVGAGATRDVLVGDTALYDVTYSVKFNHSNAPGYVGFIPAYRDTSLEALRNEFSSWPYFYTDNRRKLTEGDWTTSNHSPGQFTGTFVKTIQSVDGVLPVAGTLFTELGGGWGSDGSLGVSWERSPANSLRWAQPSSGQYQTAENWEPVKAPLSEDSLLFDHEAAYEVSIPLGTNAKSVEISKGEITFNLDASTDEAGLSLSNLNVGPATLVVRNGSVSVSEAIAFQGNDAKTSEIRLAGDTQLIVNSGAGLAVSTGGHISLTGTSPDSNFARVLAKSVTNHGEISGAGGFFSPNPVNIATKLVNANVLRPNQSIQINPPVNSPSGPVRTAMFVDGDFEQLETGKIVIDELSPADRSLPGENPRTQIYVKDEAILRGALEVNLQAGYKPWIGHRFGIVNAASMKGRIKTFENPFIDDTRFFGLIYEKFAGRDELQLVTLETPRRIQGTTVGRLTHQGGEPAQPRKNLVLVTHGTRASLDSGPLMDLARNMYDAAEQLATNQGQEIQWDVVGFDWEKFNGGSADEFNEGIPAFNPMESARNGIDIGESIFRWLTTVGLDDYENVHLLGHSSGSWLVDSLADEFDSSDTPVHLTLFDAFTPPFQILRMEDEGETTLGLDDMGDRAVWTEHFFDHNGTGNIVGWTQEVLPNAFNVDVSSRNPTSINPISSHAYPYVWYLGTTEVSAGITLGFSNSPIFAGTSGEVVAVYPGLKGDLCELDLTDASCTNIELVNEIELQIDPNSSITTGNVEFGNDDATLTTQSPAILTTAIEVIDGATSFSFDFEFLEGADGLLSVYAGDEQVYGTEQSLFDAFDGPVDSGFIFFDEPLDIGMHSLTFRLDPLEDDAASVTLSDLRLQSFVKGSILLALPGDFDGDGVLSARDVDRLAEEIRSTNHSPLFDLNDDLLVDDGDLNLWVNSIRRTWFGDANLDGEFNSGDLVDLFTVGEYEDGVPLNSTWATGDFNGDGDFTSGDLVAAFTDGGYEQGPRPEMKAIPEPSSFAILVAGLIGIASVSRSRGKRV